MYYNIKNKYESYKILLEYNDEDYFNKKCPEEESNWKELLTFSWVQRIINVGYFRPINGNGRLELNDIEELPTDLKVQNTAPLLNDIDFNDSPWPLIKHIYVKFIPRNYISVILFIIISVFSFITPLILKNFLEYVQNKDEHIYIGIIQSFLLFFSSFIYMISQQYGYWYGFKTSIEVKGALETTIFQKMLKLSNQSKKNYNSGSLVNLMSTDSDFFQFFFSHYHIEIFLFPIQILSLLGFLIYVVGFAGLVGFLVMIITMPISTFLGTQISKYLGISMSYADSRISLTGELINGIRFLKQYAWERNFVERIEEQRRLQLKYLYIRIFYWILVQILTQASSGLVLVSTFTAYTLLGHEVTLDIAFTAITIFVNLRRPIEFYPDCLHKFISLIASAKRIETFLQSSELQKQPFIHNQSGLNDILIKNSNFNNWGDDNKNNKKHEEYQDYEEFGYGEEEDENLMTDDHLLLNKKKQQQEEGIIEMTYKEPMFSINGNIDFRAPKGKLTIISGGVRSGKTSLVSGLIGEIYNSNNGIVEMPTSISFTTQQPFLLSSTVRENILFGKEMNMERYIKVIESCCLGVDLLTMPGKDLTEIGNKTLSGGQKARIQLARALYADSECYILDEVLSSVDPEVAIHIFQNCIQNMMKGKTVILVTHQVQFISSADHIVVVDNGVLIQGTYQELIGLGIDFEMILREKENRLDKQIIQLQQDEDYYEEVEILDYSNNNNNSNRLKRSSATLPKDIPIESVISTDNSPTIVEKAKLFVKEDRNEGDPGFDIYKRYIKMGSSYSFFFFTCSVYLGSQVIFLLSDYWLQKWASRDRTAIDDLGEKYYLLTYLGYIGGFVFSLGFRYLLITHITFSSAEKLHRSLLKSVTNAPLSFFEQNPLGRILNRFGKDISDIDIALLDCFSDVLYCGACLVTSIGIMIYITPYIAIPFAILIAINYFFQLFYNYSVLELKRIQSISRSPVFSLLTEVHNGLNTIRSYNQQSRFYEMMVNNININLRVFFYGTAVSRWVGIRLEFLSGIIVLMSALFSVFNDDPGLSALGVTTALSMTSYLNWFIRQFSEIDSKLNSVERIQSYISIPPEQEVDDGEFIQTGFIWPPRGEIEFKNVEIRYRGPNSEPSLKNFSMKINPGERIGIIGRSGSGKSTIGSSLFRMVECYSGVIYIDGEDISQIGLKRLRGSIGIIPQDPFIFSGSLRLNIDPFDQFTDLEIWDALDKVKLKKVVSNMPMKLESIMHENGDGLTVGQKQLLCLSRAILKSSKIILLDEAINSIDFVTAQLIKRVCLDNFKDCTVLTIANKLDTIIDSDKIAVICDAELVEFDSPINLIRNGNSRFAKLVKLHTKNKKNY